MNPLIITSKDSAGDNLEAYVHNDRVTIQIDEPWAGSTETGFGQTCSIGLTLTEARQLGEWLLANVPALPPVDAGET